MQLLGRSDRLMDTKQNNTTFMIFIFTLWIHLGLHNYAYLTFLKKKKKKELCIFVYLTMTHCVI